MSRHIVLLPHNNKNNREHVLNTWVNMFTYSESYEYVGRSHLGHFMNEMGLS